MENIRKSGIKFWNWLFSKSAVFSMVAVVVLAIIDISDIAGYQIELFGIEKFQIGKILYYLTILGALLFGYFSTVNTVEISGLESEIENQKNEIKHLVKKLENRSRNSTFLFDSYLKLLFDALDFSHSERISLYTVENGAFKIASRVSFNPNYNKKGRLSYPLREGFIGKGWEEGKCFIENLPDPKEKDGNTYYFFLNRIAPIEKSTIDKLNMKSRSYFTYRLDGFNGKPKSIVVIESINPDELDPKSILAKLEEVKRPVISFLENEE